MSGALLCRALEMTLIEEPRELQKRVDVWGTRCFGIRQMRDPKIRALRLVEESLEFAQAVGVEQAKCYELVGYVFGRPAGEPRQELGGVAVTALAAASAIGQPFELVALDEINRVESKSDTEFALRNQKKLEAGFGG